MPAKLRTGSSRSQDIRDALHRADHILAITHVAPDGDAIGSLTAVGVALQQLGRPAALVCDDGVPSRFLYLPLAGAIKKTPDHGRPYDLIIALDAGDTDRLGEAYATLPEPKPPLINIDHHVTNTQYGQINLVDASATSTAEILFRLLPELGATFTPELAACLLTGLVADTLGFRTSGVTAATLKAASVLVEAGADLYAITTQALTLKPLSTILLWRLGLEKMRLEEGVAWTSFSWAERQALGHGSSHADGLGNLLADTYEVAMSVTLLEQPDGRVTVGFRCRPPYNVADLAQELGGGGHRLAAGCTLPGPLDAAEALVVARCQAAIRQQRAALAQEMLAGVGEDR